MVIDGNPYFKHANIKAQTNGRLGLIRRTLKDNGKFDTGYYELESEDVHVVVKVMRERRMGV